MGRWEPNAQGRLEQAALELYSERGFEQTTVAEIARRAGLTERTFFRHFADKREVLFGGAAQLQDFLVSALASAPDSAAPIDAVAAALETAAALLQERYESARLRQAVIAANAELQERETVKLATLSAALAGMLRQRGVKEPAASLTADAGIAVFRVAFEAWISDPAQRDLSHHMRESFDELKAVAAGR
jgi:AcrR family transcriptional regulator